MARKFHVIASFALAASTISLAACSEESGEAEADSTKGGNRGDFDSSPAANKVTQKLSAQRDLSDAQKRLKQVNLTTPGADDIGPEINTNWCKSVGTLPYTWTPDTPNIRGARVTFQKRLELKGLSSQCPSGPQVSNKTIYIPKGQTVKWCSLRVQPGHCDRLLTYTQEGQPLEVHVLPSSKRVEENIAGRIPVWYGVRDCGQEETAKLHAAPHFDAWIQETLSKYSEDVGVRAGYSGNIWYENRTADNGKRSCKGGFDPLMAYVEFE